MTPPLNPKGRRARILKAAFVEPVTLSAICRRVKPTTPMVKRDESLHRLKVTSALRNLKADGLVTRTPQGWRATAAGREAAGID